MVCWLSVCKHQLFGRWSNSGVGYRCLSFLVVSGPFFFFFLKGSKWSFQSTLFGSSGLQDILEKVLSHGFLGLVFEIRTCYFRREAPPHVLATKRDKKMLCLDFRLRKGNHSPRNANQNNNLYKQSEWISVCLTKIL